MRVNYIQGLERPQERGVGNFMSRRQGKRSGAVTPGAELKVEREKPGREPAKKARGGTVQADAALTGWRSAGSHGS